MEKTFDVGSHTLRVTDAQYVLDGVPLSQFDTNLLDAVAIYSCGDWDAYGNFWEALKRVLCIPYIGDRFYDSVKVCSWVRQNYEIVTL